MRISKNVKVLALFGVALVWWNSFKHGSKGASPVVGKDVRTQWYKTMSDGAFVDLIDSLRDKGLAMAGDPPRVTARAFDAVFVLIHDVEGPLRITILDQGASTLPDLWAQIDKMVKMVTS